LTSVPRSYTQAALALGASPAKAAWQIVLPTRATPHKISVTL